jgi:hypothetical protein
MHRKGHKTRKSTKRGRKLRGGYYGASGPIEGTNGAMKWGTSSEMTGVEGRAGNSSMMGGRRRKGRKATKRKMRGGNKYGGVSASFQGNGTAGMADYNAVSTRGPGTSAGGQFNNHGAGPGSTF